MWTLDQLRAVAEITNPNSYSRYVFEAVVIKPGRIEATNGRLAVVATNDPGEDTGIPGAGILLDATKLLTGATLDIRADEAGVVCHIASIDPGSKRTCAPIDAMWPRGAPQALVSISGSSLIKAIQALSKLTGGDDRVLLAVFGAYEPIAVYAVRDEAPYAGAVLMVRGEHGSVGNTEVGAENQAIMAEMLKGLFGAPLPVAETSGQQPVTGAEGK